MHVDDVNNRTQLVQIFQSHFAMPTTFERRQEVDACAGHDQRIHRCVDAFDDAEDTFRTVLELDARPNVGEQRQAEHNKNADADAQRDVGSRSGGDLLAAFARNHGQFCAHL